MSSETDVAILLLHFYQMMISYGLQELWLIKSANSTIPIHTLAERLGQPLCSSLIALHILMGSDVTSKIGTKTSALKAHPEIYLQEFGLSFPPDQKTFSQA